MTAADVCQSVCWIEALGWEAYCVRDAGHRGLHDDGEGWEW